MTTCQSPLPEPLTRTDVTLYDHIWKRASPDLVDSTFGRGQVTFSPPLKHITIESTQGLIENFDPLDVLDSASETSASSSDTMIMMTTEEERRNSERIKNSLLNHELRKALVDTDLKQSKLGDKNTIQRSVPNNYVSCQQMLDNAKQFRDNHSLSADDGYSTDSRSNTTALSSSPLSSSLSSVSTFEGSVISAQSQLYSCTDQNQNYYRRDNNSNLTTSSNIIMQRGPIQKGPNLHGQGRAALHKHGGLGAKRRDVPMETSDCGTSLEDRLRALTTIEEEDSGMPMSERAMIKNGMDLRQNVSNSPRDLRYNKRSVENPSFGSVPNYDMVSSPTSGCFRAVPVSVVASDASSPTYHGQAEEMGSRSDGHPFYQKIPSKGNGGNGHSTSPHLNGDGWKDYTRFFEKDCDIPLRNIDPAGRGKFSNFSIDDVPDMDINRQIGTGSPAHPKKHTYSFNRDGDRLTSQQFGCDDQNAHGERPFRSSSDHGWEHANPDSNTGTALSSGVPSFRQQSSRQHHVMTSMPDLRAQDLSWLPGAGSVRDSRNHPSDHQSHPYLYQNQQQHHQPLQPHPDHPANIHPHYQFQQRQQQQFPQSFSDLQLHHGFSSDGLPDMGHPQDYRGTSAPSQALAESYPEVVMRRSHLTSSARAAPGRPDRYSWQAGSSYDQQHLAECTKLNQMGAERSSLDLGNIPQLQRQIRATSELCLQASRRHLFASSADIYKLFSGQKKPPLLPTTTGSDSFTTDARSQAMRHSFHTTPSLAWQGSSQLSASSSQESRDSPRTRAKLRIMVPPAPATGGMSSPGPVRADHSINIPPEAWTSVTSLPNSASTDIDRLYFQRQPHPLSSHADMDRYNFQRPASATADLYPDSSSFQRQSSGYSSETELQQIESNARKLDKRQGKQHGLNNSAQEFVPLNRSADRDSNAGTDIVDDQTDSEPVYMNQAMLTRAQVSESLSKPSNSEWVMSVPPAMSQPSSYPASGQHQSTGIPTEDQDDTSPLGFNSMAALSYRTDHTGQITHPKSNGTNTTSSATTAMTTSSYSNSSSSGVSCSEFPQHSITQHQVINFKSKPVTITSHVPAAPFPYPDHSKNSNSSRMHNSGSNNPAISSSRSINISSNPQTRHDFPPKSTLSVDAYRSSPYLDNSPPHPQGDRPGSQTGQSVGQSIPVNGQLPRPRRTSSNSSVQLSPVEIAQMLDVPFATNIISDERGDRLSTLV